MFVLSSLVTGPSFMSISWLILELGQFLFIKDWPEIWKFEIPLPEFCPISEGWSELGIPDLVQMSLIKSYWMLQNAKVTTFTVFLLLRQPLKQLFFNGWTCCLTILGSASVILVSSQSINFYITDKNVKIFVCCSKVLHWLFTWGTWQYNNTNSVNPKHR